MLEHKNALRDKMLSQIAQNNAVIVTDLSEDTGYVNQGFTKIEALITEESLRIKSEGLFQGLETDNNTVAHIEDALGKFERIEENNLNCSTKSPSTCQLPLDIFPIFGETGSQDLNKPKTI